MIIVKDNDVYTRQRTVQFTNVETIIFKKPTEQVYEKADYDWYMQIALEKTDLVKDDRHLLTYELIYRYRYAIREGYNHTLDPHLNQPYSYPRNRNTIQGIIKYCERIEKLNEIIP